MDISEADIIRMKKSLADIPDPRREWGNLWHNLIDMLVIALTTIIIGEHDFDAMEAWGLEREEWFRGFLELPRGYRIRTPFAGCFERLQPKERCEDLYFGAYPPVWKSVIVDIISDTC
jgi:hypothetical protein